MLGAAHGRTLVNIVPRRVPHSAASHHGRGPFWSHAGLAALSLRLHAAVQGSEDSVRLFQQHNSSAAHGAFLGHTNFCCSVFKTTSTDG